MYSEHFRRCCKSNNWPAADTEQLKGNGNDFDAYDNEDFSKSTLVLMEIEDREMWPIHRRRSSCLHSI